MGNREFENYLYQSLGEEVKPKRLEETINDCTEIVREQKVTREEVRTDFFCYLSDVFRFEGIPIFAIEAFTLFIVCLTISSIADVPRYIPMFIPLFILAVMPVLFKSQLYGMSEIEAVTRASGAQIMLAKLVLAGAANLVCITTVLFLEVSLQNNCDELGQMILYCLVPYLVYVAGMLRVVRLQRKESIPICAAVMLASCVCWAVSAHIMPWLYTTSAVGLWIVAFVVFGIFFAKEIYFVVEMRREGKMYGIIA